MQTGRKILNLRHDRKISQQDLAAKCNITPSALSKIEANVNAPRANIIWRLAKQLSVTVEYLLDESLPYPYPGNSYSDELRREDIDPNQVAPSRAVAAAQITEHELRFIQALRESSSITREIAFCLPAQPPETLRLLHFLLHHGQIANPDEVFLAHFERLLTHGSPYPIEEAPESSKQVRRRKSAAAKKKRRAAKAKASSRADKRSTKPAAKARTARKGGKKKKRSSR